MPIAVQEDTAFLGEQFLHQRKSLIHHVQIRVGALAPHVTVGDHFERGLVFFDGLFFVAYGHIHLEISADVKRRVDVDEIHLPFELGKQAGEHELVVAPDEPVAEIVAALVGFFETRQIVLRHRLAAWLIDGLDFLHGHRACRDIHLTATAVFVVFTIPDKLSLELGKRVWIAWAVTNGRSVAIGCFGHGLERSRVVQAGVCGCLLWTPKVPKYERDAPTCVPQRAPWRAHMKTLSMRPQGGAVRSATSCVPKFPRFRCGQQPKLREMVK